MLIIDIPKALKVAKLKLNNAQKIAAMKHGQRNAFAGTDSNKTTMDNATLFAKKDINLIIKPKHIVKKSVHGIIFMKENGTNVWLAHKTVFGSQAGTNVDAMEVIKKLMENVF